jgi:hypothetical protein
MCTTETRQAPIRLLVCTLFDVLLLHTFSESTSHTLNGAKADSGTCDYNSYRDGANARFCVGDYS